MTHLGAGDRGQLDHRKPQGEVAAGRKADSACVLPTESWGWMSLAVGKGILVIEASVPTLSGQWAR